MKNLIRYKHISDMNIVKLINKRAIENAPTQDELREHYLYQILDEVHSQLGYVNLCSCYSNFYSKRSDGVSLIVFPRGEEFIDYQFSKNDFWRNPGSDPLKARGIRNIERICNGSRNGYINYVFLFRKNPFDDKSKYVQKQYIERNFYIGRLLGYKEGRGYPSC